MPKQKNLVPLRTILLIYCFGNNKHFAQIALEEGFLYGARLPGKVNYDLFFADQDFKKPDREKYMAGLKKYRPQMATVLDIEDEETLATALDWAVEAAQYARMVLFIPKMHGIIKQLPRHINGTQVGLGYSVPTRYGGTTVPIEEFAGWPIHLLGGSPHAQMRVYQKMSQIAHIISTDGNYIQKMAMWGQYWMPGTVKNGNGRFWQILSKEEVGKEFMYVAFRLSCRNVMDAWAKLQWGELDIDSHRRAA